MNIKKHAVSCIIPAYNEEKNIGNVLKAVENHPLIDEVVVIDDCSNDKTAGIASSFASVRLIRHEKNSGKSKAVLTGIKNTKGDILLLIDADLTGLTKEYISELIDPVLNEKAYMAMSLRKFKPLFDYIYEKIIGFDPLSGERIFRRNLVDNHLDEIAAIPNFGLEVFLNKLAVKNKIKLKIVVWPDVATPTKSAKHGKSGFWEDLKMHADILKTISIYGYFKQIYEMRKLIVKKDFSVSLIIPAYNEEKYIGDCLEHAIKSSNGFFHEILVVDNASTDKTAEVASEFPGVRVIREDKKGITKARQRGYMESTGDILAYNDADTRMPSSWCNTLLNEFQNEKIVALSGKYVYYNVSWIKKLSIWMYWYFLGIPTYWITGYMIIGGNFAIRRKTLEKMGGFDTTIDFYGEDTDIARRASKFGKVKFKSSFSMETSPRRLNKQGTIGTAYVYVLNFLHEIIMHKPATKKYEDYR